jgi:SAM-dependent methyltransferase
MEPSYGASSHYEGQKGETYFARQNNKAHIGGKIEARKFASFIREHDSVLDFGCGGGFTIKNIRCLRRAGGEINELAQPAAVANGLECVADLADLPSDTFDVVIANHSLEHVPNPILALKEMQRVLKAGGKLVLVTPIDDWRRQRTFRPGDVDHHLFTWTPQLLGNCLVEAGFGPCDLSTRVLTHAWFPGCRRTFALLPRPVFDALAYVWSVVPRQRQAMAVAVKPGPNAGLLAIKSIFI